jgi:hypothetical protein
MPVMSRLWRPKRLVELLDVASGMVDPFSRPPIVSFNLQPKGHPDERKVQPPPDDHRIDRGLVSVACHLAPNTKTLQTC